MADRGFNTPPGTSLVTLEPSRTGLSQPLQIHIQDEVEGVQAIHPDTGIFVPRNEVEKTNILNYINSERGKHVSLRRRKDREEMILTSFLLISGVNPEAKRRRIRRAEQACGRRSWIPSAPPNRLELE